MARNEGVIPTNDDMFNNYYRYLAQLAAQRTSGTPPEWPHVPAAADGVVDGYAGWYTVYALTLKPHAGTPGQIVVPYRDENSAKRGKPANVHGVEVRYAVLDHEPASREELVRSAFDTNSPLYLNFGEEDRGKRVYMYGCWEIEREGPAGGDCVVLYPVMPLRG
jgi:hypothetical protein